MASNLLGKDINFRGCKEFLVCLEYGAAGAYQGAYCTGCKVTRVGAGNYTIKLPQKFKRLLGGDVCNGALATTFLDDTALASTGIVTVTFTEPAAPRRVFIRMVAPTNDFNQRSAP